MPLLFAKDNKLLNEGNILKNKQSQRKQSIFNKWIQYLQYLYQLAHAYLQSYQKSQYLAMISITDQSMPSNQTTDALKGLFQNVYANFLLFLKQKSINFEPLPKEITPFSLTTSFAMHMPLNGTQMSTFCKIQLKWATNYQRVAISILYKMSTIGGMKMNELNNRTRIQLISSLSQINQYLKERQSCLNIIYDHFEAFAFHARETIVTDGKKASLKRFMASLLQKALIQFVKYAGELNEVDFFRTKTKNNKFSNMRQLLETLYISKAKLFVTQSKKQQKSIKKCLSFMLANVNHHNSTFQQIKQQNQNMANRLHFQQNIPQKVQTIGNAIRIHKIKESASVHSKRFYQNLQKNKAASLDSESITLRNITFELRKSFGSLRQNKQHQVNYIIPSNSQDPTIFQEHVVFKRYIQSNALGAIPSTQSTSSKSREQMGHINQHNFLMVNANLKCPYIGKYYLNINQSSINNVAKRTIMTRMEQGDLFTEVAYNTYHRFYQFQFIQYLTIFEQLAKALCFLHQNKIIHRDIKPTNVLFRYHSTNNFICKLIDFGSCYIRQEESAHMFNPKVFTTPRFNLTFKNALKLTNNEISKQLDQDSYQSHQLFDVYAIAETVSYLLCYSTPKYQDQYLNMIINICKHPDPNLRFTPQQLLTLIQHMKLNVISSSSLYNLLYCPSGNLGCFQNN